MRLYGDARGPFLSLARGAKRWSESLVAGRCKPRSRDAKCAQSWSLLRGEIPRNFKIRLQLTYLNLLLHLETSSQRISHSNPWLNVQNPRC